MQRSIFLIVSLISLTVTVTSRWQPSIGMSWQWQLAGTINTSYDVDIYDIDLEQTPQSTIDQLHGRGIKIICYFSGGSWENYRSDASQFPDSVKGNILDGWPDQKWLDISNYSIFADIMKQRLNLAVNKSCDAVQADNMDGYQNDNGLNLTANDQLVYNKWMAEQAHSRGLSIALKNDLGQVTELVDFFDFSINEQCFYFNECDLLKPFIEHGKPVFGVEYDVKASVFCPQAKQLQFQWLEMTYDLAGERIGCQSYALALKAISILSILVLLQ